MEEDVLTPALTGVGDEPVLREGGKEGGEGGRERGREGGRERGREGGRGGMVLVFISVHQHFHWDTSA